MRIIFLLISMAIMAYLTANYLNSASVTGVPGTDGTAMKPTDVLEQTKVNTKKIEEDMAKRAVAPMPSDH